MNELAEDAGSDAVAPHPFLLDLALRLLRKADRSRSDRATRLRLDRNAAPDLHSQVDAESLQGLRLLIDELCTTGWVRLVLGRERDFASWIDRDPQLELLDFDALANWSGFQRKADHWNQQLITHLQQHGSLAGHVSQKDLLDYLARSPVLALSSLSPAAATDCLRTLAAVCATGKAAPLRRVSAQVFHGRSKVLDNRDELLRLLGATPGQFFEAPIQLLIDMPASFDEVLFIENLVTFEQMADERGEAWTHSLLVYAAGFKGSARRLRSREGCRIYLRASPRLDGATHEPAPWGLDAVTAWLFGSAGLPVRFFGDLDFAGMQILASLRETFGDAQAWKPGYDMLRAIVQSGGGHAPDLASKERHIDPGRTGCTYADDLLLPLMRDSGRFLDQEAF